MSVFGKIPAWYFGLAIAFSFYYAYRGYMGNWIAQRAANEARVPELRLSKRTIVSVFCLHDMLFHFISSMAGFVALFVSGILYDTLVGSGAFDTGKSVLLAFAFVFGIVGATGQLPQLILQGKMPGLKS